jgi:dolichol-phosphate mannosyltransferase
MLTVVVPTRNEEKTVGSVLREILRNVQPPLEVLVVDASTDGTARVVRRLAAEHGCVRLVPQDGKGWTAAFATGLAAARGEALAVLVADGSDAAADIEAMRRRLDDGFDLVCASRYMRGGKAIRAPSLQGTCSLLLSRGLGALLGIPTRDLSNSFKMYRTRLLRTLPLRDAGYATSMQLALRAWKAGWRITEVPTTWTDRRAGSSKFVPLAEARHYLSWSLWALRQGARARQAGGRQP